MDVELWGCDLTDDCASLGIISNRSGTGTGIGIAVETRTRMQIADRNHSSQYQPVTSQYQPINVNISIRIASPGNDGPVTQTNLALAMPVIVQTAVESPRVRFPVQWFPAPIASVQTPVASVQSAWSDRIGDRHRAGNGRDALRDTLGSGAERRSARSRARHRTPDERSAPRLFRSLFQPAPDHGRGDTTGLPPEPPR